MNTYEVIYVRAEHSDPEPLTVEDGEVLFHFRGDMKEASAPIRLADKLGPLNPWLFEGAWISTPYRTLDAHHNAMEAGELLLQWLRADIHPDDIEVIDVDEGNEEI